VSETPSPLPYHAQNGSIPRDSTRHDNNDPEGNCSGDFEQCEKEECSLLYAMLERIQTHLKTVERNPEIRVVILNAKGPVVSSGHDLQEL